MSKVLCSLEENQLVSYEILPSNKQTNKQTNNNTRNINAAKTCDATFNTVILGIVEFLDTVGLKDCKFLIKKNAATVLEIWKTKDEFVEKLNFIKTNKTIASEEDPQQLDRYFRGALAKIIKEHEGDQQDI